MRVVVRLAGPDGALVELDALVRDAAEDHGAQAAVADGQGFDPEIRGLAVPESERGLGAERHDGKRREEDSTSFHEMGQAGACPNQINSLPLPEPDRGWR